MKVTVDDQRCRGHGMCRARGPEVLGLTHDGDAVAAPEEVPARGEDAARAANENSTEHTHTQND